MRIKVNGQDKDLEQERLTVAELLALENVEAPEMVSVQVNGGFLARDGFSSARLKDGDEVDFLYFMGGGAYS